MTEKMRINSGFVRVALRPLHSNFEVDFCRGRSDISKLQRILASEFEIKVLEKNKGSRQNHISVITRAMDSGIRDLYHRDVLRIRICCEMGLFFNKIHISRQPSNYEFYNGYIFILPTSGVIYYDEKWIHQVAGLLMNDQLWAIFNFVIGKK